MRSLIVLLGYVFQLAHSFTVTTHQVVRISSLSSSPLASPPSTPVENVVVLKDADSVGDYVREIVSKAAHRAIEERGCFSIAIPGGSILNMLAGDILNKEEWTSKTTLAYVNHKCVSMDDEQLATHAKACKLFLDEWEGVNAIVLDGTADGEKEAQLYEEQMRSLADDILPKCSDTGLPIFDLALIGVGDDGHVGSLYPDREEVLIGSDGSWVLPVSMKEPPSITLSLPVMANAREVIVAACGVSEKYPQGKSEGMRRAVVADSETLTSFPAVGLRDVATWVMDEAAASKLGDEYNQ
jgi:6-phosphogluconolactonase